MSLSRCLRSVPCALFLTLVACDDAPTVILGRQLDGAAGGGARNGVELSDAELVHARGCDSATPVCGANGKTYHNHCRAEEAGVRVVKREPCH